MAGRILSVALAPRLCEGPAHIELMILHKKEEGLRTDGHCDSTEQGAERRGTDGRSQKKGFVYPIEDEAIFSSHPVFLESPSILDSRHL